LRTYLGKQGKLVLLLDPPDKADSPPLTNLVALAHDYGIDVGTNVVVDVSGMGRIFGGDVSVPVSASYPSHPINKNGEFNIMTAFPLARSVMPVPGGVNAHTAQTFVETGPNSWAESNLKELLSSGKVGYDEGADKKGPIAIGAAVSVPATAPDAKAAADAPKPEARVVVMGDSDFAANGILGIAGNRDLFMNVIGWASQQENLISIRPKEPDDRRITLTATEQWNIFWFSLLIVPGFIFGSGVYSWWRRR